MENEGGAHWCITSESEFVIIKISYAGFLLDANANKWYQALDLKIINSLKETLYTGISTKGSTNTLRLNVGRALAAASHAVHFYSWFDVILEFDYANQVINVIQ